MYSFETQLHKLGAVIAEDNEIKSKYLADDHSNYAKTQDVHGHLNRTSAYLLYANNNHARLKVAGRVFEEMEKIVGGLASEHVLQLTLTPGDFTVGELDGSFDPTHFKRLISRYFGKVNMLGLIEPGFFPRLSHNGSKGTVSFHVHAIAWGISPVALRTLALPFKKKYLSHFVNLPSAYVQVVPVEDLATVLGYQYKPPNIGYDVAVDVKHQIDPTTGEVLNTWFAASYKRKRLLRKGERVRVDNSVRDLTFDKLLVATGEGKGILRRINHDLLREYRARSR